MFKFDAIPQDITKYHIAPFIELQTFKVLSLTSRNVHNLFRTPFEDLAHQTLLQAVVDDNLEKVKIILQAKPELLLKKPKIGLCIESELTGQIFMAEEALKMATKRGQVDMVEFILPFFDSIMSGQKEALKQLDACAVSEETKKKQKQQYADKMDKLMQQILREMFPHATDRERAINRISNETKKFLETFREELLPKTPINLDHYFDLEALLHEAYNTAINYRGKFQHRKQEHLYYITIIGYIQSVLSPELAKIFCEGLYAVVENKKSIGKLADSFKVKEKRYKENPKNIYRSKSDIDTQSGCGFDFFVDLKGECNCLDGAVLWLEEGYIFLDPCLQLEKFEKLCQTKNIKFDKLKTELTKSAYPKYTTSLKFSDLY